MRIGVIVFHKNNHIYDKRWIDKFVCSILEQTYSDFVIYEVDYGGGSVSVFNGYEYAQEHKFYTENFNNHAEAMNFLIDRTLEDSCDYVFNTNIDDYYEKNRFEIQLTHLLDGYDLVSSNFDYIKDDGFGNDIETLSFRYDDVDIIDDLINGNNCIAHPCVAYSRAYLLDNVYYPSEILVATQHTGYYSRRGTPETNPASLACVNDAEEMEYFVGAFNGGKSSEYIKMAETLSNNIDIDYSKGIIAVWHDESHMNRYFIDNKPTKILNPSYCYGESMNIPFDKKLLALDKKHEIVREL